MKNQDYTIGFSVQQTPEEVFAAINNVRGWWSKEIEGRTDKLGARFDYHYRDVHRSSFKITGFEPGRKVVWRVEDNFFNFVKDRNEWIGTDIVFEIVRKGETTEVRFTHVGLVPKYECYEVCSDAWGSYITGSLRNLITRGKGQPNPIERVVRKARQRVAKGFKTTFLVDKSPGKVFDAINNVRAWWSGEIRGTTDKLGAEFTYRVGDAHRSTQKITEFIADKRVVWHVLDASLNFVNDKDEWKGTDIVFDIVKKGAKTEVRFAHRGLVPAYECYDACSNAWGLLVKGNLRRLINTGKVQPSPW